jgi:hypothetical protein
MNDTDAEAIFEPDTDRLNDDPSPDSSSIQDTLDSISDDDEIFRISNSTDLPPPVKPNFEL